MPKFPLLSLQVKIKIARKQDVSYEYPNPKPKAYLGFDYLPSPERYDVSRRLQNHWYEYMVDTDYPPYADRLFIRLDGGFQNYAWWTPAYTVHSWYYHIKVEYTYCDSDRVTGTSASKWDLPISHATHGSIQALNSRQVAANVIHIPYLTRRVTFQANVTQSSLFYIQETPVKAIFSPDNFLFENSLQSFLGSGQERYFLSNSTNTIVIDFPKPGPLYVSFEFSRPVNFEYAYTLEDCEYKYCSDIKLDHISKIREYDEKSNLKAKYVEKDLYSTDMRVYYHQLDKEDMGRRYGFNFYIPYSQTSPSFNTSEVQQLLKTNFDGYFTMESPSRVNSFMNTIECLQEGKCYFYEDDKGLGISYDLMFLKSGMMYFSVNITKAYDVRYEISLYSTNWGDDMWNGSECYDYQVADFDTYLCYCFRNKAGQYCEIDAFTDSKYWVELMFITLSNFAMIPVIVMTIRRYFGECAIYLCTMISSYLYHWCDTQYYWFSLDETTWRIADFYCSFFAIVTTTVFAGKIQNGHLKLALMLTFAVMLMYIALEDRFSTVLSAALPIVIAASVPFTSVVVYVHNTSQLYKRECWNWSIFKIFLSKSDNFRWKWLIGVVFWVAGALTGRACEINSNYWLTHSTWHLFIMLAPFFVYMWTGYQDQWNFNRSELPGSGEELYAELQPGTELMPSNK